MRRHVSAFNPLDGVSKVIEPESGAGGGHDHTISFEYYIKIVPTIYTELNGKSTRTFQVTDGACHRGAMPF